MATDSPRKRAGRTPGVTVKPWYPEETAALEEIVAAAAMPSWENVAEELGTGRTAGASYQHYRGVTKKCMQITMPRFEAEMRALIAELTLPEATAHYALACCSNLVEAIRLHEKHCTVTRCHISLHGKGSRLCLVPKSHREAAMVGCVLVYALRQQGLSLTFKEVLGALNASKQTPATIKVTDIKCFDMLSQLLRGFAERRFACCSALPATDALSSDAPSTTTDAPATDTQSSEPPASEHEPPARREQSLALLQRCCHALEWGPRPTDIATQLFLACSANIFERNKVTSLPQSIVSACIGAVHNRYGARLLPCLTDGSPLPLLPVCGVHFVTSKFHILGSDWAWKLDCLVEPGIAGPFRDGPDGPVPSTGEPSIKRQATGPRHVHVVYERQEPRRSSACWSADAALNAGAAAANRAGVRRKRCLYISLLQRQRTDKAQRAVGMLGMSPAEQDQLRAAVAALEATLNSHDVNLVKSEVW